MSRGSLSTGSSRSLENSSEGEALLRPHRNAWHARYLRLAVLGACLAFLLTLTLGAASALAVTAYVPAGEFARETLGPVPTGIAVDDATGHVLVVDSENNRVVVFESGEAGAGVLTTFGEGELSAPSGIAIDQTNGDVYVSDAGNNRIVRYTTDGAPVPTYTLDIGYTSPTQGAGAAQVGSFASPLAIDPLTGDLLVADTGNLRVERFDSGGAFLSSFDGSTAPSGAFTSLFSIATGPDGTIYLIADGVTEAPFENVTGSIVESFAADGSLDEVMRGPGGSPTELDNSRALAYDTRLENVLVATDGSYFVGLTLRILHGGQQVSQMGVPTAEVGSLSVAVAVPGAQVAPISILTGRSVEAEAGVAGVQAVKGVNVEVTAPIASAVTASGAHLAATVNPHGDSGSAQFEYRRVGGENWTVNPEHAVSAENAAEPIEEDLAELLPDETYEVRITASVLGVSDVSSVGQFHTVAIAPVVVTQGATGVSSSGATLNGSVNPNGTASTWFFEYGVTAAYGTRIPLAAAPTGLDRVAVSFSRAIGGLSAGSTYHYRIVAENAAGVAQGADRTFVVSQGAPEARAYEQVTPVDGGGVNPDPHAGALALSGTSGISYLARPAGGNAASSPFNPRLLALRGENNWLAPVPTDPRVNNPGVERLWKTTLGVSADGTHTFFVTNEKLTPAALEGRAAANLYVEDLRDGSVQFVAATAAPGAFDAFTNVGASPETFIGAADDLSWVVFYSGFSLYPGVTHSAIYRWSSAAGLEVLSRLPDNSLPETDVQSSSLTSYYLVRRWVSDDGSTTAFGLRAGGDDSGPIYMRHGGVTVPIPLQETSGETRPATLISTDVNGRYAYFTEGGGLAVSDVPGVIFRYDSHTGGVDEVGTIPKGPYRSAFEAVLAVARDGSSIAFDAEGPEGPELAVWHEGELRTVMQGAFQGEDGVEFSPDGRYLAFSYRGDVLRKSDVYLYDSSTDELECASCLGGQPTQASNLPVNERLINNREAQFVDDKGQVFFTTTASLAPGDANGEADVYMFQGAQASLISPGDGSYPAQLMDISPDGTDVYFAIAEGLVAQDVNGENDIYDARVDGGFAAQNRVPAPPCEGEACQGAWQGAPAIGPLGSEAPTGTTSTPLATPTKPKAFTRAQKLAKALKVCRERRNKHKRQACEKTARKKFGAKPRAKAKSHKGGK